jgi:superfamily II DNA or RNA helicase
VITSDFVIQTKHPPKRCGRCRLVHSRASELNIRSKQTGHGGGGCHEIDVHAAGNVSSVVLPKTLHPRSVNNKLVNQFVLTKKLRPRKHQAELLKSWGEKRFMLLYWKMGSGKTHGALFCALRGKLPVLIVCSKTLISQWEDSLEQHEVDGSVEITVCSYEYFDTLEKRDVSRACVIVDEAHNFKNMTAHKAHSFNLLKEARRLMLLSGTPLSFSVRDFNFLLELAGAPASLCVGESVSDSKKKKLASFLRGKVSYHAPSAKNVRDFYPDVKELTCVHAVHFEQALHYFLQCSGQHINVKGKKVNVNGKGGVFVRLSALNGCTHYFDGSFISSKLRAVEANVKKLAGPHVIYSRFKRDLLEPLAGSLQILHSVGMLTGDTEASKRGRLIKDFNEKKLDVLIICKVGAEGLDLTACSTFHLLEPQMSTSAENQIVARVVRARKRAPKKKKRDVVSIVRYIACWPKTAPSLSSQRYLKRAASSEARLAKAFPKGEIVAWLRQQIKKEKKTQEEICAAQNAKNYKNVQIGLKILQRA